LIGFEKLRKENRELKNQEPPNKKADEKILEYDQYNRSTNDAQSHRERFNILRQYFNTWLEDKT
jgi:hypothetical protein